MSKGYIVVAYRSISNPEALAAYRPAASAAIDAAGGRYIVRGVAQEAHEAGLLDRIVVVEFGSVEQAAAFWASEPYRKALALLGDGAERDVRIVEGVG
jgi:uncharacterized protein (DUF1330 family)